MMDISIEKLCESDFEALFEFELENRGYFEKMVPGRGEDYYHFEAFTKRNEGLLEEQSRELSYFYLIKNTDGSLIGRMNLVDIDKNQKLAHVGYRVGESFIGKGIANKALNLLLKTINKRDIKQILAQTTTNNLASQKVLEKNGFKLISTSDGTFDLNGESVRFVYYTWRI